jgi:hypothetical protein
MDPLMNPAALPGCCFLFNDSGTGETHRTSGAIFLEGEGGGGVANWPAPSSFSVSELIYMVLGNEISALNYHNHMKVTCW